MTRKGEVVRTGITFGSALVIVHGLLSWIYVVYYALRYHFKLIIVG